MDNVAGNVGHIESRLSRLEGNPGRPKSSPRNMLVCKGRDVSKDVNQCDNDKCGCHNVRGI